MSIALIDTIDLQYCISILNDTYLINLEEFNCLNAESIELKSMLIASKKTSRKMT